MLGDQLEARAFGLIVEEHDAVHDVADKDRAAADGDVERNNARRLHALQREHLVRSLGGPDDEDADGAVDRREDAARVTRHAERVDLIRCAPHGERADDTELTRLARGDAEHDDAAALRLRVVAIHEGCADGIELRTRLPT